MLAQHRHRERLVDLIAEAAQQRQHPHHPVRVDHRVEEAGAARRRLQQRQVRAIAAPVGDRELQVAHDRAVQHRCRQLAADPPFAIAGQVVAEHRRRPRDHLGERRIVAAAGLRLGEQDVEADDRGVALPGQPVREFADHRT
ncbi:MAG TPA: hypothetical protein PKA20_26630 [Burkholderiaceae bacterium]|nr:hypothetical protein [Burkholderiaceae bacterium]